MTRHRGLSWRGKLVERDLVALDPVGVVVGFGELALDRVIFQEHASRGVDEDHLARRQAALAHDLVLREFERAHFGGVQDLVVRGDLVARRTQAVAIERRDDLGAIAGDHIRWAVPRLHHGGVVFEEALQRTRQAGLGRPRRRHHHRQGVRQTAAGAHQEFQRVIKARGVAAAFDDHRFQVADRGADVLVGEQRFTRLHAVDVATQGVDFAVVRDEAERMRQVPRRESVRAVALMHQRDGGFSARVIQIEEVLVERVREEHALVDDGAGRQRVDVEQRLTVELAGTDRVLGALACQQQLQLELRRCNRATADENLLHQGLAALGDFAKRLVVGGHIAPAEQFEPVVRYGFFDLGDA